MALYVLVGRQRKGFKEIIQTSKLVATINPLHCMNFLSHREHETKVTNDFNVKIIIIIIIIIIIKGRIIKN